MVLERAGETGKFDRVLLVEDYEPWRRSIRSMLQNVSGVQVIGEVPDGLAAVQQSPHRLQESREWSPLEELAEEGNAFEADAIHI